MYLNKKQLEKYRPTVTGIGWATIPQAAIYLNVSHRRMSLEILPQVNHVIIGDSRRVRYTELDRWLESQNINRNLREKQ